MPLRLLTIGAVLVAAVAFPGAASAQEGHFVTGGNNAPTCTDIGTQLQCEGKVSGLGGTTFEITVSATGTAVVTCANPGNNDDVPGQRTSVTATGSSGPLPTPRNGNYEFTVTTETPTVPNTPTCPNAQWTATVTDVIFDDNATLSLFEDDALVDQFTVTGPF